MTHPKQKNKNTSRHARIMPGGGQMNPSEQLTTKLHATSAAHAPQQLIMLQCSLHSKNFLW